MRVLIVDESDDEVALATRELHRVSSEIEVVRASDAGVLTEALVRQADIVLTEWSTPKVQGSSVLALCRAIGGGPPVIVLSSNTGEQVIVDAIRAGARNFVSKRAIERLADVIESERAAFSNPSILPPAVAETLARASRSLRVGPACESQVRHSQQIEGMGRLASGVAHDFNNLMSIVVTYSSLIASELAADSPLQGDLREIKRAGERATALTRQLLAFSNRPSSRPSAVNLNQVLLAMEQTLRRLIGDDVNLSIVTEPELATTMADPYRVEQLVLNLVVNARDAIRAGGRIVVETANVNFSESYAAEHRGVRAGPHVMVAVTDSGVGMSEEMQARLFEPFFSTKGEGKSKGLGLPTVLSIVKACEGSIWVDSTLGEGSTFRAYLPITGEAIRARPSLSGTTQSRVSVRVRESGTSAVVVDELAHAGDSAQATLKRIR